MTKIKLTYKEMEARLAEAEEIAAVLRNEEVDAIVGKRDVLLLRLREMGRELHDNERLFRTLTSSAPVGILQADVQGNLVYVNKAICSFTGLPAKKNGIAEWATILHPDDQERVYKLWTDTIAGKATFETEFRFTGTGKDVTWVKSQISKLKDDKGNVIGYIGTLTNITDLKQIERTLYETNDRNWTILNTAIDGFWMMDTKGHLLEVNESYCQMSGYSKQELLALRLPELEAVETPEDTAAHIQKIMVQGKDIFESRHRRKDGTIYDVEISIQYRSLNDGCFIVFIRDISERKQKEKEMAQMQAQLRQTQKMEAVGTLAGGIAHDFNNILAALIGYTDLAKDDIPEGTLAHQNLQEVLISANRAKELVKQILTFSRKDEAKLVPVKINAIVAEALKMLRSSLPTTIEINQDINCNNAIMANETHIHQVLMNLGTNAAHAMEENGGVLEVKLADVNIDSDIMTSDRNLQPGSYVKLSVKDTGCGMSKDVAERIFEPFFTTKGVGKGTGLGLSVVHGIIENHNGIITVNSKPGKGTTFEIFFPCVENIEIIETGDSEVINGHGEQILLVDDEHSLVDVTTQMLTRIGYKVVGKTNSLEALEVFQEDPDKFDLVITDQTMPKMTGTELAKQLLTIRPDISIVLCTGYSETVNKESVKVMGIKELVMKPVKRKEISQIIREILDKKGVIV